MAWNRMKKWLSTLDMAAAAMNDWLLLIAIGLAVVTGLAAAAPRQPQTAADPASQAQPGPQPAFQAALIGQD